MPANVPPTLDGLVFDADEKARELLRALHQLEDYADSHLDPASDEGKLEAARLSNYIWQAIGLTEGACHMLDHTKTIRPRCYV